jgi:hypothetical protein|tara:strand:- start:24 stop:221 length:198 start_codon:yes stop_codon:yes gene_type:complete
MSKKERGRQWDGVSRPSNDTYAKNWKDIFNKNVVNKDEKRTYKKKIDHSTDISFENEVKKGDEEK